MGSRVALLNAIEARRGDGGGGDDDEPETAPSCELQGLKMEEQKIRQEMDAVQGLFTELFSLDGEFDERTDDDARLWADRYEAISIRLDTSDLAKPSVRLAFAQRELAGKLSKMAEELHRVRHACMDRQMELFKEVVESSQEEDHATHDPGLDDIFAGLSTGNDDDVTSPLCCRPTFTLYQEPLKLGTSSYTPERTR